MPHAFFQDHHGVEEIFPLDGEKLLLGFTQQCALVFRALWPSHDIQSRKQ
jgi:hypothetical protein